MRVSIIFEQLSANFQEFKVAAMREVAKHPVAAFAMLVFPLLGVAVLCVWGARKVFLSHSPQPAPKVNQVGLKAINALSANGMDWTPGPEHTYRNPLYGQAKPTNHSWAETASHIAVLVGGTVGLMLLFNYLRPTGVQAGLPYLSCTSLVPYNPAKLFAPQIPLAEALAIPMTASVLENTQCLIKGYANETVKIVRPLVNHQFPSQPSLMPFPYNSTQMPLNGIISAIFILTMWISGCCGLVKVKASPKKVSKLPDKSLQLARTQIHKPYRHIEKEPEDAFSCTNMPKGYFDMLTLAAIDLEKSKLIEKFNGFTPDNLPKLDPNASFAKIGQRYKVLSLRFHSDHGGEEELSGQLNSCWKVDFVNAITKIYRKRQQPDEIVQFSVNTDDLEEIDEKVRLTQQYFTELYSPQALNQLIVKARDYTENEFFTQIDLEDSLLIGIELNFLKSSLITAINELITDETQVLNLQASFKDISECYLILRKKANHSLSDQLKNCWRTKFVEKLNTIFKSVSPNIYQEVCVDELDEYLPSKIHATIGANLDLLRASLIWELNDLVPEKMKLLDQATFKEIGKWYHDLQADNDVELKESLKMCWETEFIEPLKKILKSDIDHEIEMEALDLYYWCSKEKMKDLRNSVHNNEISDDTEVLSESYDGSECDDESCESV